MGVVSEGTRGAGSPGGCRGVASHVLWSVVVLAYMWVARRPSLCLDSAGGQCGGSLYPELSQRQWPLASGTDQAWIFSEKCSLTLAGLLFCWIALLAFSSWRGVFVSRFCGGVCGRQDALMMGVSMCAMLAGPALYLRAAVVAAALLLFGSRAKPPRRARLDA
jgi:hypothetical protein